MSLSDISGDPPPTMKEDWRDTFLEFLNEKVKGSGTCEKCSSESVMVTPALVTCPIWNPKERAWSVNGTTYPFALLVCRSCGHVNLYSAALAGIKKEDV